MEMLKRLEDAYNRIEDSFDQAHFLDAVKAGTRALQGLNDKLGTREETHRVLESLQEEASRADEGSTALGSGNRGNDASVGEDEVMAELASIESEETAARLQSIGDGGSIRTSIARPGDLRHSQRVTTSSVNSAESRVEGQHENLTSSSPALQDRNLIAAK